MMLILEILAGLLVLSCLVVAHELGHAISALKSGVVVEEFGVGFPPKVWSKKLKNKILLTINLLPMGGFVKLQGEYDAASNEGDYGAASFWQKSKILLSGVAVNWLIAAALLSVLAVTGLPKIIDNQFMMPGDTKAVYGTVGISSLVNNYPAKEAGFKTGDKILRFNGRQVTTIEEFISLTRKYGGKNVAITISRGGSEIVKKVVLSNNSQSHFGAGLSQKQETKSTWSAPIVGVVTTVQYTWATLQGIGGLVANLTNGVIMQFSQNVSVRQQAAVSLKSVGDSVSGPIGILGVIFPAAEQAGATQLVLLTAIISLSLAVMNILPIPALDGGRWVTMALFKLFKKKLTKEREERIQTIGFSVLMVLFVLITIVDVAKIF